MEWRYVDFSRLELVVFMAFAIKQRKELHSIDLYSSDWNYIRLKDKEIMSTQLSACDHGIIFNMININLPIKTDIIESTDLSRRQASQFRFLQNLNIKDDTTGQCAN